ncbi:MAG: HAMP domain-containing protein, partial [Clostridia bacterium]|nr:HAMP domain-containing protein [Clostridia bacterium]
MTEREMTSGAQAPGKTGRLFSSLRAKLLLAMILGVLCSFAAYAGMHAMGSRLIDRYYLSQKAVYTRNRANIEEFQSYVQSNNLSLRDTDAISRWTIAKQDVYILFYQNERLALEAGWWGIDGQLSGEESLENVGSDMVFPVVFRDGQVQAVVYDYSQSRLYDLVTLVSIIVACAVFALILLSFNGRVTRSIISVSRQVQRIGEGNLQLQLEPKGTDELALLTASVEQMRLSILHKTAEEQKALEQNSELITAMSHDIRNPLTALI